MSENIDIRLVFIEAVKCHYASSLPLFTLQELKKLEAGYERRIICEQRIDSLNKMKSIRVKKDGQVEMSVICETDSWKPRKLMSPDKTWNEVQRKLSQVFIF